MEARLCPGCSQGYQDPISGMCPRCMEERTHSRYVEEDHAFSQARREAWRDRQRRSRERRAFQPGEPLGWDADPLETAAEALAALKKLPTHTPNQQAAVDSLVEMVKQLAWGPE